MTQAVRVRRSRMFWILPMWITAACSHCATGATGAALWRDDNLLALSEDYYVVRASEGDSYWGLAREHNVPLREILTLNQVRAPHMLEPGELVRIPTPRVHVVRRGETLIAIARGYRVDFYDLAQVNALFSPFTIYPGQVLRLPSRRPVFRQHRKPPAYAARPAERRRVRRDARPVREEATPIAAVKPRPKPDMAEAAPALLWPVRGPIISDFGPTENGRRNDGINIAVPEHTPVRAAADGVVIYRGNEVPGYGNLVLIRHADDFVTAYAHASEIRVEKGQRVRRGELIALSGSTGNVAEPQLHFEVRRGVKAVDPFEHLRA